MDCLINSTRLRRSLLGTATAVSALLALCTDATAASLRCKHFPSSDGTVTVCHEPGAQTTPVYGQEKIAAVAAVYRKLDFNGNVTPYRVRRCWSARAYDGAWASVSIRGGSGFCEPTTGRKHYDWQPENLIVHRTSAGWRLQYAFDETSIKAVRRAGVPAKVFYGLGFYSMS